MSDYTTAFAVDQTPEQVFDAINNVRGWWGTNVDGPNTAVGDEFIYRVGDIHYSKLRVAELVPNQKIVWLVLDNHLNFVDDQTEWVGTRISFQITPHGNQTQVRFTHLGLDTHDECYDICSDAWGSLMHHSLPSLITTGAGHPYS